MYVSQQEFHTRLIENELIHKGLELLLKPNIRNYYQEFIDNWFSKLKDFSFYFNEKYCYVLWQNH